MLVGNLQRIVEHGRRADNIVKSMLAHSRRGAAATAKRSISTCWSTKSLNLAYHGARAQDQNFNVTIERAYGEHLRRSRLCLKT